MAVLTRHESAVGGWFAQLLARPAWSVDADESIRDAVSNVLHALLVVVFAGLFLYLLPGSQLGQARGTVDQMFAGWAEGQRRPSAVQGQVTPSRIRDS